MGIGDWSKVLARTNPKFAQLPGACCPGQRRRPPRGRAYLPDQVLAVLKSRSTSLRFRTALVPHLDYPLRSVLVIDVSTLCDVAEYRDDDGRCPGAVASVVTAPGGRRSPAMEQGVRSKALGNRDVHGRCPRFILSYFGDIPAVLAGNLTFRQAPPGQFLALHCCQ